MTILIFLGACSIAVSLISLVAFWWTVGAGQYDDPKGDAERILSPVEDRPLP